MYRISKQPQKTIDSDVPESLEEVLNSLETLLEHRSHVVPETVQEAMESFADSIGEQYDDPLVPESHLGPSAETVPDDIPVLNDVVRSGDDLADQEPSPVAGLDTALDQLRGELDTLVEDILDDARDRFNEVLDNTTVEAPSTFADNINDLMRDALARRNQDK